MNKKVEKCRKKGENKIKNKKINYVRKYQIESRKNEKKTKKGRDRVSGGERKNLSYDRK